MTFVDKCWYVFEIGVKTAAYLIAIGFMVGCMAGAVYLWR